MSNARHCPFNESGRCDMDCMLFCSVNKPQDDGSLYSFCAIALIASSGNDELLLNEMRTDGAGDR